MIDWNSLNEDRYQDLFDTIQLANFWAARNEPCRQGLQQVRIVEQIGSHADQVSDIHFQVVENTFDQLQVRAVGRKTPKRYAVVAQEGVVRDIMYGRVGKHDHAIGQLSMPRPPRHVHTELRDEQLQKKTPVCRFQPPIAISHGLEVDDASVTRDSHRRAGPGHNPWITASLLGSLYGQRTTVPAKKRRRNP